MKTSIALLVTMFTIASYSQTPITDANFDDAIADCLSSAPEDGLCTESDYGIMPEWNVSSVTKMNLAFFNLPTFNADISKWDVGNVTDMTGMFYGGLAFNQDLSNWDVKKVNFYSNFDKEASSWREDYKPNFN